MANDGNQNLPPAVIEPEVDSTDLESVAADLPAGFFPMPERGPSVEYQKFIQIRATFQDLIAKKSPQKENLITELTNGLLDGDKEPPTGFFTLGIAFLGLGKRIKTRREKRESFSKTVNDLLVKIFDPSLEFRMTKKDILDVFEANGFDRDNVSKEQIRKIYVSIINTLEVGHINDNTWNQPVILEYLRVKIKEIKINRRKWEVDH